VSHVIEDRLAYQFRKPDLLETALTHRSVAPAGPGRNNETLEFLGDAVLELIVSDLLMRHFPRHQEGDLSKMRASLVNARVLADKARALGLGEALHLGKGEEKNGGRDKESILGAAYEALLGAIFLDRGFGAARRVIGRQFASDLKARAGGAVEDCKTRLQEITQRVFKAPPTYTLVRETGPDHAKHFVSQISIAGRTFGRGEGRSKKSAEQAAAMQALRALENDAVTLRPERAAGGEAVTRSGRKGASRTGGQR
jgi:ribonuclease-3